MLIVLEVLERLIKESRPKAYGLWEGHGTWGRCCWGGAHGGPGTAQRELKGLAFHPRLQKGRHLFRLASLGFNINNYV